MAYYCGECVVWVGSSDVDRHGRRWCSYSRKYEESNQQTYGCKGFVYVGRAVITAVSRLLDMPGDPWFSAFDRVREQFLVPSATESLLAYCRLGPVLAQRLLADPEGKKPARRIADTCLIPAARDCQQEAYETAVHRYRAMIASLMERYHLTIKTV